MDARFQPAVEAIRADDLERFRSILIADPSLATAKSKTSHPTLLQCAVLEGKGKPHNREMAVVLVNAGAELAASLIAAASINNKAVAELLIDCGANVDGEGGWSPLEEALYWNSKDVIELLIGRVKVQNLRIAAGLGRTELIEKYFNSDGSLRSEAGQIDWPFGDVKGIEQSNHDQTLKQMLSSCIRSWSQDRQGIIDNAFVYACMHGHTAAAQLLLDKGAEPNAIAGGFDYSGTGLHYAALNGHKKMVEFLLAHGADSQIKDTKVGSTAAGWAEYGGHPELVDILS